MPMIYNVPSSVNLISSFSFTSKYDLKKEKNQILYEKDFGTVVLKVPDSVLSIESDALSNAYYMYSVCYNGTYFQDEINYHPNDFLSNFFVKENYFGTTFFGYPLTGFECDESIPDAMIISHVIGNTKLEKILSITSISLSSLCVVAIVVLIVVIYYYKKTDDNALLSNYYSVDNKINSFYT
ncbi:hypothetical protein TVAG_339100 [Trichomonas vaginalis G3]|uniref:Uncharacterized protein n=1 Tax=Trichomonas vaginalis (strain ATCC PRA-98 / G3) TaxID=412133 RepID=A2FMS3_TRIV3|nr:leucine-rich repeats (6 copies)-containing protein [Trichomonas vaginalis G3]EAX93787.1 hypothetical protein TVAG_339100 [Trichomonas vaginalis G3]KAI5527834.1 leucine-rich repeats (6 copies)-containing protein [Trichomonas vaginalis G3]|eukprot:XP_001306717.1 hypothetical protein [Trichomonas vaginalis G3]